MSERDAEILRRFMDGESRRAICKSMRLGQDTVRAVIGYQQDEQQTPWVGLRFIELYGMPDYPMPRHKQPDAQCSPQNDESP